MEIYEIEIQYLKTLFLLTLHDFKGVTFEAFIVYCKKSYLDYYNRNNNNLEKFGNPKTFSQWINGQIISLT